MASSCARGCLDWTIGKISSAKRVSGIGTGCPQKWLGHRPWRNLTDTQMWHVEAWLSDGLGTVKFMVELDMHKGPFQPKWFCSNSASFTDVVVQAKKQQLTVKEVKVLLPSLLPDSTCTIQLFHSSSNTSKILAKCRNWLISLAFCWITVFS